MIEFDEFEAYATESMDAELIGQDLDDIDLYGEIMEEDEEYDDGGILYE